MGVICYTAMNDTVQKSDGSQDLKKALAKGSEEGYSPKGNKKIWCMRVDKKERWVEVRKIL